MGKTDTCVKRYISQAKLDFVPTNKWIYNYLGRRRRKIFTVMVHLQKKRAVLARPTQKATQRAANTHKSPFRPSLQRIERWHIVQPLNFVVTKSHGEGNCWPAFTRALRRACTLCMHVRTGVSPIYFAAHLGSSQTISAAENFLG